MAYTISRQSAFRDFYRGTTYSDTSGEFVRLTPPLLSQSFPKGVSRVNTLGSVLFEASNGTIVPIASVNSPPYLAIRQEGSMTDDFLGLVDKRLIHKTFITGILRSLEYQEER